MRVDLIGWTETVFEVDDFFEDVSPYEPHSPDQRVHGADEIAEFAGRSCYESWSRPNPETASNRDYVGKNLIAKQHYSVLEHANFTVFIKGVSRTLTHELVRHRHFSFSQKSQRYVDESYANFIIPPVIRDLSDISTRDGILNAIDSKVAQARSTYRYIYESLVAAGCDRKEARGAARSVLPAGTETAIVVTGNIRCWREFFDKRISPGADQEIRELANEILRIIQQWAPNSLQDFEWSPDIAVGEAKEW